MNTEKSEFLSSFFLEGDLCQMGNQKRFLIEHGIRTEQVNVYPVVKGSDLKRALTLIWENRVDGWWHYKNEYVKLEICTEEQFDKRLMRS
jgi:hypothetical protein